MKNEDFNILLANEKFQNGVIHFGSMSEAERRDFVKQYSIGKEEFLRARTIIDGLSFKQTDFTEDELNYLWDRLGIENSMVTLNPKLQTGKIISWFSKIASILFIPLLFASIWVFTKTQKSDFFNNEKISQLTEVCNTVFAPVGGKTKAILPDGSEVWLNSGSSIQYPILSKPGYREVKLTGEGFFKVTKKSNKPMLVTTSGLQLKVYGTTFNISAYDDDPDIKTVLVEGKISIVKLDKKDKPLHTEYKMNPGELVRLDKQKNTITITNVGNIDVFTGWVNGKYVFKNMKFKEILRRLERLHNVEFVLEDKTLEDYSFDATFEDQNIDRVMEIFAVSLPIKWRSVKVEQNNDSTFSARKIIISEDHTRKFQ